MNGQGNSRDFAYRVGNGISRFFPMRLYIGLIHYPVYNKNKDVIASAVTPVDLHDLARTARTYAVKGVLIITPLEDQLRLVRRVCSHWTTGFGAHYNPHRKEAMELVSVSRTLGEGINLIGEREGVVPVVLATDAVRQEEKAISFAAARAILMEDQVVFLLFGTAWGLTRDALRSMDGILEPIMGPEKYNHLSVRSASAIILDRLVGTEAGITG